MLSLLKNCPHEVAHLRRDLLVAARYILGTELRVRFIPCIDQLFNEDIFIGTGWTTRDAVRSMAYSILVDVVHHVRSQLSLNHLSLAVQLFSKNVHDPTLPITIQNISCKLLLNLMESIRVKSEQDPTVSWLGVGGSLLYLGFPHFPFWKFPPPFFIISSVNYFSWSILFC